MSKKTVKKTVKKKGKKHVNSTKIEEDGIKFDSKSELFCYKLLKSNNLHNKLLREPTTFTVVEGPRYKGEKLRDIVVTPDFIDEDKKIILEIKGRALPDFKMRWKLLKIYLYNNNLNYDIYLIKSTQTEITKVVNEIKTKYYDK